MFEAVLQHPEINLFFQALRQVRCVEQILAWQTQVNTMLNVLRYGLYTKRPPCVVLQCGKAPSATEPDLADDAATDVQPQSRQPAPQGADFAVANRGIEVLTVCRILGIVLLPCGEGTQVPEGAARSAAGSQTMWLKSPRTMAAKRCRNGDPDLQRRLHQRATPNRDCRTRCPRGRG